MSSTRLISVGDLRGVMYDFVAGEKLEMHLHDRTSEHVIIVGRGRIKISGPKIKTREVGPGGFVDPPENEYHEIEALEDTRIFNLLKYVP